MRKMQSVVTYIRNLLGWPEEDLNVRTSYKRDRNEDFFDDDSPSLKRLKQLNKTSFHVMSSKDLWKQEDRPGSSVRYVPIQVESDNPSTSTPKELPEKSTSRIRNVPIKLVNVLGSNSTSAPTLKPRVHTPVRPVIHAIVDDDDDPEITLVENKSETQKKNPKVYVIDEDDSEKPEEDVIFVKKISTPPPVKPYKFFIPDFDETDSKEDNNIQYYRLSKLNDRKVSNTSPRGYTKFKEPPGITKSYKKVSTLPRWMQTTKPTNLINNRSKILNGTLRNTLSQVFDLDEKRNYQELIRRVTGSSRPFATSKPSEIINLADDSASFRLTQRSQKKSLNDIKLLEKRLSIEKENEATKEYDPITVASIGSSDSEVEIVPSETSSSSTRIDPINTLKDSYRDKPITEKDWLYKLDGKYKKKRQLTQKKLKEVRLEDDIITKVNCEQKLAHLQHKLKYELSIPESLFEEAEPVAELPQLTPEQEKLIDRALGPGPPNQLLVEKFNLRIHRRDLQTLSGLNWLNDEVINFYMNLLMQRSEERKDLPKVYAANTFFYPKLMQSGQAGLRRWTRKVDIFAHDLMVVPVHLGVHWCVSLVNFRNKRIEYLDSMGGRNQPCLTALMQYLRDEHKDKKGEPFNEDGWKTECLKDIPQQMNGSDCGMFSCTFAEFSSRGAKYTFDQSHMPYLRRKAALEILTGKLLL